MCQYHICADGTYLIRAHFHARAQPMGEPTNTSSQAPFEPSRRQLDIFEKAGISPAAARAIADIDVTMRRVRRNVTRRELTSAIVASIDPELEISHLDVLE